MSFKSWCWLWRKREVSDCGLEYRSWFQSKHWSLMHPYSKFLLFILILRVLKLLIWGFRGGWRFLTWICYLDFDLDMVISFWYNNVPKCGSPIKVHLRFRISLWLIYKTLIIYPNMFLKHTTTTELLFIPLDGIFVSRELLKIDTHKGDPRVWFAKAR